MAVLFCFCIKCRRLKAAAARADVNVEPAAARTDINLEAPPDRDDAPAGDGLEAQSVKWLKAEAQARGVRLVNCVEKADMVAALRAAPPVQAYAVPADAPADSWNVASAAQDAASTTPPPIPSAPPMNAGFAAEPPFRAPSPVYAPSPPPRVPAPSVPTVGVEESKESTPSTQFEELPRAGLVERGRNLLHVLLFVGKALPGIGHFCDAAKDALNSVEKYWEKVDDVKAAGATVVDVLTALKQMSENVEEFQHVDQKHLQERIESLTDKLRLFKGAVDEFGKEGWYKRAWMDRGAQSLVKLDKEIREKLKALDSNYGLVRDAENNARHFETREYQFRMETKMDKLVEAYCASERCDVPTAEAFLVNDPDTLRLVAADAHVTEDVLKEELAKISNQMKSGFEGVRDKMDENSRKLEMMMKVTLKACLESDPEVRNLGAEDRNELSMIAAAAGVPVLCRVINAMNNAGPGTDCTNEGNVSEKYYKKVKKDTGVDLKDKARRKMLYAKVREVAANKGLIKFARRIKPELGGGYEDVSSAVEKINPWDGSVSSVIEINLDRHAIELYCGLTQEGEKFLRELNI